MYEKSKIIIYKGIIQYLLDSTDYNLKRIARLSNSSLKNIRSIYSYNEIPADFQTELQLIRLYQTILELEIRYGKPTSPFSKNKNTAICSNSQELLYKDCNL